MKWFRRPHIKCPSPQIPALTLMMGEPSTTQNLSSALTSQPYNLCKTRRMMQLMCLSFLFLAESHHPLKSQMIQLYPLFILKLLACHVPFCLPAIQRMIFRRIHRGLLYHVPPISLTYLSLSPLMFVPLLYRHKSLSCLATIVMNAPLP